MLVYQRVKQDKTIAAWWYTYPSEKYEFVSWEYSSQCMEQ